MKILALMLSFLLVSCGHLFYQPHKKIYKTPDQYQLTYEQVEFESPDKLLLKGWHIKTKDATPKGLIVHFHGNAENRSTHFFQLAWLTLKGYDLFIPDYRGYGDSQGVASREGIYYDSHAFVHYGFELYEKRKAKSFIIWGQSLGGNIAARAAYDHQKDVDLLVLDSTFASYQDIAFDKLTDYALSFLLSPLAYILVNDKYAADEIIEKIKVATIVVHGNKDKIVPLKFGEEIYKRLKSRKLFIKFDNAHHIRAFAQGDNRISYLKQMEKFIADK